jgi:mono/diheme cytochrome c family protein
MITILSRSAPAWLAVTGFILAATTVPASAQSESDLARLPEGKGRDEMIGWCGACHSLKLVSQQRLPRWRWEELLVVMKEKHGMPELDAADRAAILDYLSAQLGPPPRRRRF